MKVAIVGSRAHPRLDIVRAYVAALPVDTVIVSGRAEGVDQEARRAALERGLRCIEIPPQAPGHVLAVIDGTPGHTEIWTDGRDLTLFRNTLIALACDRMVVFPDGSRGGCWDATREAARLRRPVEVRWVGGLVEAHAGDRQRALALGEETTG